MSTEALENILLEIEAKMDNFMGFEDISEKELKELKEAKTEIEKGHFLTLEQLKKELKSE